ncbi:NAD(P)H-binding protein [Paraburkholderia sp. J63]|uniref:NmrA family NAD(P)-binding protein n=1 Tax=Paraburkholderia sp. J63 TaxID=2805434 RepID=UPI002ABEA123|nr:NAD(P)H-binding protein [Paraburkholderia sp. J63]
MTILVSAAAGKTGQHIIAALRNKAGTPAIRGIVLHPNDPVAPGVEAIACDMNEPAAVARAMVAVDTVIHYGPPLHPRETAMGTAMIDAARAAGVRRFIFVSVIHPEIGDLVNHKAKLAIEAHLINSRLDWTVLRPQHYMQNIDVRRVIRDGLLTMPYPIGTRLGHVDMRDLAEATAKVALESGHSFATYDIAADEHLTVSEICATISRLSGQPVEAVDGSAAGFVAGLERQVGPLPDYSVEAFHRLFGYYARMGISGNANVASWLLGRTPGSFENYVRDALAGVPV